MSPYVYKLGKKGILPVKEASIEKKKNSIEENSFGIN